MIARPNRSMLSAFAQAAIHPSGAIWSCLPTSGIGRAPDAQTATIVSRRLIRDQADCGKFKR
jgi:hypothetical protein